MVQVTTFSSSILTLIPVEAILLTVKLCQSHILRVSDQSGVSLLYIMLEIHHPGRKPLICMLDFFFLSFLYFSFFFLFDPYECHMDLLNELYLFIRLAGQLAILYDKHFNSGHCVQTL